MIRDWVLFGRKQAEALSLVINGSDHAPLFLDRLKPWPDEAESRRGETGTLQLQGQAEHAPKPFFDPLKVSAGYAPDLGF